MPRTGPRARGAISSKIRRRCSSTTTGSRRRRISQPRCAPLTRGATVAAFLMANVQVVLGRSTLLYLVPVPLAATHQAGSVALLSAVFHVFLSLRRPGAGARA
ncbi:hypothetical protein EDB84DRAFT_1129693 [Lactarius hengduanensis]|nr:hypothetical protein EDB84DRAFT_1129693 [Lactarius hengduanensis]